VCSAQMETWHKQTLSRPELGISSLRPRADKKHTSQPECKSKTRRAAKRERETEINVQLTHSIICSIITARRTAARAQIWPQNTGFCACARSNNCYLWSPGERRRQKVGFSQTKRGILKTCAHGCIRLNRRRGARFAVSLSLLRGAGSQQKEKPSLLVVLAPRLFTFN